VVSHYEHKPGGDRLGLRNYVLFPSYGIQRGGDRERVLERGGVDADAATYTDTYATSYSGTNALAYPDAGADCGTNARSLSHSRQMVEKGFEPMKPKLTERQVRIIKEDRESKYRLLAERFEISVSTVANIKTGRREKFASVNNGRSKTWVTT
jgi:hypothetical protein